MSPPAPPRNPTDSTSASLLLSGGGGWATFPPHVLNSDLQPALWGPARLRSAQTPAPRSLHRALELCTAAPTQPPPQHLSLETLSAPLCPGMDQQRGLSLDVILERSAPDCVLSLHLSICSTPRLIPATGAAAAGHSDTALAPALPIQDNAPQHPHTILGLPGSSAAPGPPPLQGAPSLGEHPAPGPTPCTPRAQSQRPPHGASALPTPPFMALLQPWPKHGSRAGSRPGGPPSPTEQRGTHTWSLALTTPYPTQPQPHPTQPHICFLLHPVHTSWCVASLCTPLCPPKHRTQHSVHYATVLLTALHINKLGAELGCWYTRPRSPPHPRVQLSPPPPLPATGAGLGGPSGGQGVPQQHNRQVGEMKLFPPSPQHHPKGRLLPVTSPGDPAGCEPQLPAGHRRWGRRHRSGDATAQRMSPGEKLGLSSGAACGL